MSELTEKTEEFIKFIENNEILSSIQDFYEINKDNIDISANNEYAFREACRHGHLEIAKSCSSET